MAAIVSIVGKAKTGKTTLLEKLVSILSARGYRVATAKHVFHGLAFDKPGKDSWRHINAGSQATVIGSSNSIVMIQSVKDSTHLDQILRLLGEDYDLILVEGFKQSDLPKIEVHRKEKGQPLASLANLIAIATDEELCTPVKQLKLSNAEEIADFIENNFIKADHDRISIYINEKRIPLDAATMKRLMKAIPELIPTIKDTTNIQTLELTLRSREKI